MKPLGFPLLADENIQPAVVEKLLGMSVVEPWKIGVAAGARTALGMYIRTFGANLPLSRELPADVFERQDSHCSTLTFP